MSKFFHFLRSVIFNAKIILTAVALVFIWHLGPLLAEQYHITLRSPDFELLSTITLLVMWIFYGVYHLLVSTPEQHATLKNQPLHQDALGILKSSFLQALNAIHHSKPRRLRARYQRPWILLLGDKESGKSTLLRESHLKLLDANSKNPNTGWHWYLNEQAIFLDVAGEYAFPEANSRIRQSLWNNLLKLSCNYRPQQPFSAILLVIDLPSLCQMDQPNNLLLRKIKQQLASLQNLKRNIPITVLINKIDLMSGFSEFFNDLDPGERKQLLGFTVPNAKTSQELNKNFSQQFNHFIAQMSQRLIWRLHQERSLRKRGRLKDFPLQLERLKPFLEKILQDLPLLGDTPLNGFYFSSSIHQAPTLLLTDATRTLNQNNEPGLISKSYFSYGLLTHLSHASHYEELYQLRKVWRRLGAYPATAVMLTLAALLMHYVYQKNLDHMTEIQNGLKLLATATEDAHHQPWITKLDALNKTMDSFSDQAQVTRYQWIGMGEAGKLQDKTAKAYEDLLNKKFTPYLQEILQTQIKSSIKDKDAYGLFSSLKTYLMLTESKELNAAYVNQWFSDYWKKEFKDDLSYQRKLTKHLTYLSQNASIHLASDFDLIKEAQKKLSSYPKQEQALLVLQDQYQRTDQALLSQKHALPGIDFSHATIPSLYDLKNFNAIYDQKIPALLSDFKQNAWVFGESLTLPESTDEKNNLVNQIRSSYIEHYAESWKKAMYSIEFSTPKDFKTAQESIGNLANVQSTFWRLITIMINNASINTRYNNAQPDANLVAISNYLNGGKDFESSRNLLGSLGLYLNLLAQSHDVNNTAYIAAVKHIQESNPDDPMSALLAQANHLPLPIQSWFKSLTEGCWELILGKAASYLDYLYTTTVFPEYTLHINNNYPIFKKSPNNIGLDDFNSFFGPQGTVDTFFNYYMKPFVNTKNFYWKWEKIDGKTLPIPQAQLEMFLRASLIRKMFYATESSGPALEFELKPEALSASVHQVNLNIGGQTISFDNQHSEAAVIHWPGPEAGLSSIRFELLSKQNPTITESGNWGWFRLLDTADLETTTNAKQFKVIFKAGDNTASYKLIAPSVINPYLPNILDKFRLEPSLLENN